VQHDGRVPAALLHRGINGSRSVLDWAGRCRRKRGVATRLVISQHLLTGVAGNPRQIPVLTTSAPAIPLVHADRDELLTAGRACPRRIRVDPASGVVHLAVLGAPAAFPLDHARPAPRLKTVAMTAITPEGVPQLDLATVRAALQEAALSLDGRPAPIRKSGLPRIGGPLRRGAGSPKAAPVAPATARVSR
jgi:hypothetical protein